MTNIELRQRVAEEVRAAVARSGAKGNQIAEVAGLPSATYSRKSRGLAPFNIDEIGAIAIALDVDPAIFIPPRQENQS